MLFLAVGFTAYQAREAQQALNQAQLNFEQLTDAVAAGDHAAAQVALDNAQQAASSALDNTHGPLWSLASSTPLIGSNVAAARLVAAVANNVAHDVLPSLLDASESLSPMNLQRPSGRVRLRPIEQVSPLLQAANRVLRDDLRQVRALDPEALLDQVASPVRALQLELGDASSLTSRATLASKLLPPMLGADGKQTYLVLF
jgi:hypothetical protein